MRYVKKHQDSSGTVYISQKQYTTFIEHIVFFSFPNNEFKAYS